ncbi:MAG TPA: hypothetical protein VF110_01400 [Burkholderiales bacterium]|mgnify:CR=1 FL=1
MKKLIATVLTGAAVLCTPAAFGGEQVRGESLDSGLGALPSSYTGKEFMQLSASHVAGEKQDSGLGSVSQEELRRIVSAYEASRQR